MASSIRYFGGGGLDASAPPAKPMIVRYTGIKRVRQKGRDYYYHRKTMKRLPGKPGSAEFTAKLRELEARQEQREAMPKTLGAIIIAYKQSPEFTERATSTKAYYQKVFDRLKPNSHIPIKAIDNVFLYKLRDKLAVERKRAFTNATIKVLRLLFSWAVKRGHLKNNPAVSVDLIPRPRNAPIVNRPWHADELGTVLAEFPGWLCVPIALAAFAGPREQDLITMAWTAYDKGRIRVRAHKTGTLVNVKAHYRLREILDVTPRRAVTIVTGSRGRPLSLSGLRNSFYRFLTPLVTAGKVGPGLSIHGLRHTLGTAIIDAGGSNEDAAAVLGHTTISTTQGYTKTYDRERRATAAIERLENVSRKTER